MRKFAKLKKGYAKRIFEWVQKEKIIGNTPIKSVYVDIKKFSKYALTNPSKKGLFVDSWGYKLEDAQTLLEIYKKQAIEAVKNNTIQFVRETPYGKEYKFITTLITPKKGKQQFYSGWIIKNEKTNELVLSSPFVKEIK